jgi:flavin reductase (DIM6/NTAB) family NADH-FMN oxidoreductase RutF
MTILAGHHARTDARQAERPIEADLLRTLLRRQASPVVVVTAPGEPPAGFTATSFTAVAVHQPLVSFCVDRQSLSWPAVAVARYVGVHLLGSAQEEVARGFALRGIDGFARNAWQPGPHGVPLLQNALTRMICRIVERVPVGDHAIVLAEPLDGDYDPDPANSSPLLYHMGQYTTAR